MTTVFFDLETDSLRDDCQIIQLSAAAVDGDWKELETFNMKVQFDEFKADPLALELNHYDSDVWLREAKLQSFARDKFSVFLGRHKSIQMVSKRTGKPYSVAQLAGHNVERFDMPRLKAMFGEAFLPAHPIALDTLQLAKWFFYGMPLVPEDFRLTTLATWFGISTSGAHDALADVRLSAAVAHAIKTVGVEACLKTT
jgi:DNA polymerase III alpha subunit (gram-positive type)